MKYLKGYWKDTIITWVCVLIESCFEILIAFFLQYLLKAVEHSQLDQLIMWSLILGGIAILSAILGVVAGVLSAGVATGFGKNVREAMYTKIQDFSFDDIDKFSTSSIITRSTTDITNAQFTVMMILRMILRAPFMMIFASIMAFITAPQLAWIFLIIIPVVLALLITIATVAHPYFVKIFDTYDVLNESVQENVDAMRVVKSFGREKYHSEKFNKVSKFIQDKYRKVESILAFNGPSMNIAVFTAQILISLIGANLIVSSGNTTFQISQLTTLFTYTMMITMSLMMISQVYVNLIISKNSCERINEVITFKPTISSPENGIKEVKNGDVDFENVTFSYRTSNNVLENINLHFQSGKSYGIIGPTGSSKTTLVSLIARLYDTQIGSVKVSGINVKDYDLKVLRDSVAVVLQKNTLFTGTIRDNLKWGDETATDEQIYKACDIAQASEFIKSFPKQLDTEIVEGGNNVSGGQKQRLCIARALLKSPKILILDDSTSACDTHTDFLIREGLKDAMPNVTKFIIAQRVLSIKDCDEILVLNEQGKIVAQGNNDKLMKECDVYKELYQSQQGGGDFDVPKE